MTWFCRRVESEDSDSGPFTIHALVAVVMSAKVMSVGEWRQKMATAVHSLVEVVVMSSLVFEPASRDLRWRQRFIGGLAGGEWRLKMATAVHSQFMR